jgi:DNA-binding GntR family transcriptional regulator
MGLESVPPKYAQLVQELQRRIDSGQYPPGELLPSEHQLIQEFGVSRPTVVTALRVLRDAGWVESRQGKGRYVRGRPVLETLELARVGHARLTGPESQHPGDVITAAAVAAPNRIASLLGVGQRSKVFVRRRLVRNDDEPSEIVSLWLPLELSEGTDLTSADPLPESIRTHLERRKGVQGDHVVEQILARAPTAEETRLLEQSRSTPVLVIYATVRKASGQPVMVLEAVLPADRHELEDAYPLR